METSVKFLVLISFVCFSNAYVLLEYLDKGSSPHRRSSYDDNDFAPGEPPELSHLPRSEPLLPGHTLLRPSLGSLQSAVKFPQKDDGHAVYGNLENLGLTYGGSSDRVLYSDFRRAPSRYMVESNQNNGLEKLLSKIWAPKTKGNTPVYYAQLLASDEKNVHKQGLPTVEKSRFNHKVKTNRQLIENSNRLKNITMLLRELASRTKLNKYNKAIPTGLDDGEEITDDSDQAREVKIPRYFGLNENSQISSDGVHHIHDGAIAFLII